MKDGSHSTAGATEFLQHVVVAADHAALVLAEIAQQPARDRAGDIQRWAVVVQPVVDLDLVEGRIELEVGVVMKRDEEVGIDSVGDRDARPEIVPQAQRVALDKVAVGTSPRQRDRRSGIIKQPGKMQGHAEIGVGLVEARDATRAAEDAARGRDRSRSCGP